MQDKYAAPGTHAIPRGGQGCWCSDLPLTVRRRLSGGGLRCGWGWGGGTGPIYDLESSMGRQRVSWRKSSYFQVQKTPNTFRNQFPWLNTSMLYMQTLSAPVWRARSVRTQALPTPDARSPLSMHRRFRAAHASAPARGRTRPRGNSRTRARTRWRYGLLALCPSRMTLVVAHGRWKRPRLQTRPECDQRTPFQLKYHTVLYAGWACLGLGCCMLLLSRCRCRCRSRCRMQEITFDSRRTRWGLYMIGK